MIARFYKWIDALKCWWKHDFEYLGGRWLIPKKYAVTQCQCRRCGLYREVGHDHVIGMRDLMTEEYRPYPQNPKPARGGGDDRHA